MDLNAKSWFTSSLVTSAKPKKPCVSESTDSALENTGAVPSKPLKVTVTAPCGLVPPRVDSHQRCPAKPTDAPEGTSTRNLCPAGADTVSVNWLLVSQLTETEGSRPPPPELWS